MEINARPIAAACAALVVLAACTGGGADGPPEGSPTVPEMARAVGGDVVEHLRRGYFPGRSGDILFVPEPYNVVVRWSGRGLGTGAADPRTSHSTPWAYHQRVPITLYGPGYVRGERMVRSTVDVTDLAPTIADLLRFEWEAPDGEPLTEALVPGGQRARPPRAIVVMAYDGGGWNLLEQWPDAWPVQRRLSREGTTYLNATIGSAPSVTTAIHANMGTGAYPVHHGMPEINGRLPDGSIGDAWFDTGDPRLLEAETVADAWDAANGNEPWVGMVGYETWHLGMMSRGSFHPGGDRDVAVLWEREPGLGRFHAPEEFYELPPGLPGDADLRRELQELDGEDGALDGRWMGHDLEDPATVPGTPAFVRHQGKALLSLIDDPAFGTDDLTDLLFVELKPTDFGGHIWNMVAPEEEFVLRAQDRLLGDVVDALDRKLGPDRYVLMLTADHGQTPLPETSGGQRIHPDILGAAVDEYFGAALVQQVTPSGMFLDHRALAEAGLTITDVARFVGDFRYGDGLPGDADREAIPEEELEARVFAAALPGPYLDSVTEEDIAALGPGRFPQEGSLSAPARVERYAELLSG